MPKAFRVGAIIAAAGSGERMGIAVQKQFVELAGQPLIVHTIERFQKSPSVDEIVVVAKQESVPKIEKLILEFLLSKVRHITIGGQQRQDSVYNTLKEFTSHPVDIVLVHDAVRPFITEENIQKLIQAAVQHRASVLAVRPKETMKSANGQGFFDSTLDRLKLWIAQTPQAFQFKTLSEAYQRAFGEKFYGTDDAALVERLGVKVKIVEGSYDNIKITTSEDLELAKLILQRWESQGLSIKKQH